MGTATITVTIDGGGRRPAADPAHVAAVEAGEPVSTAGLVVVALAPEVSVETRGRAVAAIGRDRRALLRVMVGADLELVRLWAMAALVPIADADDLVVIAAAGVPGALFDAIAARAGEIGVEADAALSLAAALPAIQGRVIAASSRLPPGGWVEQMLTHPDDGVRRRAAGVLSARSDVGAVVAALLRALDPDAHTEPPWGAGALFLPSVDVEEPGMAELGEHLARWMVRCETACPPGQRARIQRTAFSSAAGRWIRSRDGCGWFRDPIGCMDPEYLAHIRELESR